MFVFLSTSSDMTGRFLHGSLLHAPEFGFGVVRMVPRRLPFFFGRVSSRIVPCFCAPHMFNRIRVARPAASAS